MKASDILILGIESSCDETSASIIKNGQVLSNVIASQSVHEQYGGVVPELASRAHQQNIVPVVDQAIFNAKIRKIDINGVAFTRGPGLMGPLLVGTSFAKGFAMAMDIPLIEVNHMEAHILAHFIEEPVPRFPFICLTVSGGHTQIVLVRDYFDLEVIGETTDDAAGEAFDKAAKIMGIPYPGGPLVDRYAQAGNELAFQFTEPQIAGYNYSFSGLKTQILYFIQKQSQQNPNFVEQNIQDLCASIQARIVSILLNKLEQATIDHGVSHIAIAGGVSANSKLRLELLKLAQRHQWHCHIPAFEFCTDNAAMIAKVGELKYQRQIFVHQNTAPDARWKIGNV